MRLAVTAVYGSSGSGYSGHVEVVDDDDEGPVKFVRLRRSRFQRLRLRRSRIREGFLNESGFGDKRCRKITDYLLKPGGGWCEFYYPGEAGLHFRRGSDEKVSKITAHHFI